jgi:hypothetical protein
MLLSYIVIMCVPKVLRKMMTIIGCCSCGICPSVCFLDGSEYLRN